MGFDTEYFWSLWPAIFQGSLMTLAAAAAGSVGAILVGIILALGRRSGRLSKIICAGFTEAIRLSPFLVQLYFLYYVLPVWGLTLDAVTVGILTLSIHFGAFLGEVFGAGIDAVPRGQVEAARALGLRNRQISFLIVLPQMLRFVAAPTANYMISLLKTTPYLAVVGVPEMLGVAFDKASDSFRYVEPLTAAGILFLVYSTIIGQAARYVERKIRPL
ncbi:amino acid ABC transporter permease [Rhodovarius crocodyli]|uniref:Amino acid ABC transporter permease n=1 Tax=Rhodovarius crocodyli TaxID=1979269 RepID=A0A437M237_9PROT|nr:amino acid ABC transporter permease [Rhodovarius crocodyli]RVT91613.1 amino acid ABC transporter permease [Rhodovarius crocodyli]